MAAAAISMPADMQMTCAPHSPNSIIQLLRLLNRSPLAYPTAAPPAVAKGGANNECLPAQPAAAAVARVAAMPAVVQTASLKNVQPQQTTKDAPEMKVQSVPKALSNKQSRFARKQAKLSRVVEEEATCPSANDAEGESIASPAVQQPVQQKQQKQLRQRAAVSASALTTAAVASAPSKVDGDVSTTPSAAPAAPALMKMAFPRQQLSKSLPEKVRANPKERGICSSADDGTQTAQQQATSAVAAPAAAVAYECPYGMHQRRSFSSAAPCSATALCAGCRYQGQPDSDSVSSSDDDEHEPPPVAASGAAKRKRPARVCVISQRPSAAPLAASASSSSPSVAVKQLDAASPAPNGLLDGAQGAWTKRLPSALEPLRSFLVAHQSSLNVLLLGGCAGMLASSIRASSLRGVMCNALVLLGLGCELLQPSSLRMVKSDVRALLPSTDRTAELTMPTWTAPLGRTLLASGANVLLTRALFSAASSSSSSHLGAQYVRARYVGLTLVYALVDWIRARSVEVRGSKDGAFIETPGRNPLTLTSLAAIQCVHALATGAGARNVHAGRILACILCFAWLVRTKDASLRVTSDDAASTSFLVAAPASPAVASAESSSSRGRLANLACSGGVMACVATFYQLIGRV